ncbi:histone deacetylase 11 [Trichonephila inaurata madagascariensis]|uniref:Histone deacetylase 11 n=1 Tax=Trichonephila inaurata madagascariensis TaxID=2747483 RepID=A0A8X6MI64_9ARAC|nr:histone deacetylase 11 [Trichonephila inaurata madagascariensis]
MEVEILIFTYHAVDHEHCPCCNREMGGKDICLYYKTKNGKQRSDEKMDVYFDIKPDQLPIIYSSNYNIRFMGLQKLHPFDSEKWEKVHNILLGAGIIKRNTAVEPREAKDEVLQVVHPVSYLNKLKWSAYVARVTEVPFLFALPNKLVQQRVLRPFRFHTGGTILAGKLAMERGWALNIGGGFHHCSKEDGGGFCAYADITLCIKFLFMNYSSIQKIMIVDLDAHQGNGHERDFIGEEKVYIMDVYNRGIYPHDEYAKGAIRKRVELRHFTEDAEYLDKVSRHLTDAIAEYNPQFIVYNAGTDILKGDPLGCLSITSQGIIERDEIVFRAARENNIPIVFVTSGGYQKCTAKIIAESIINLKNKELLQ